MLTTTALGRLPVSARNIIINGVIQNIIIWIVVDLDKALDITTNRDAQFALLLHVQKSGIDWNVVVRVCKCILRFRKEHRVARCWETGFGNLVLLVES